MDPTELRAAHGRLADAASLPDLGAPVDGGWDADQVLAHVLSVDAGVAAAALAVVAGSRPGYDNRISQDRADLARIVAAHPGRTALVDAVHGQAEVLCAVAEQLDERSAAVLVPVLLVSDGAVVVDRPLPLSALIEGLATDHVPGHTRQLLGLRRPAADLR